MRVAKTELGIIGELNDQLAILDEHLARAKVGDATSIKIIAPVLRDLVCKYGSNPKPLLFRLANKYSVNLTVKLDVPPNFPDTMTLLEYLDSVAFVSGTEGIKVTNIELIKGIADQTSVAHTDNGIDTNIYAAMGWPEQKTTAYSPHAVMLVVVGYTVLIAGKQLMAELTRN